MGFRHISSLLTACFLTAGAFAADVRLGAEVALSPSLDLGPAAFHQESPNVASNGHDFLAVWIDRRTSGYDAPLFASRLGLDGRPVEPLGKKIAEAARYPHVASAGGDYLIAWHDAGGSNVLHVDENGLPLGEVRRLSTIREPRELVSNGAAYLLLESPRNTGGSPPLTATILDRSGAPVKTLPSTYGRLVWAGAQQDRFFIIDVATQCDPGCRDVPQLHTISKASGTWRETSSVFLPYIPDPSPFLAAAGSPDRIVITSHSHSPAEGGSFLVVDYEGNIVRNRTVFPGSVFQSGAAWDGREFLILFTTPEKLIAQRISRDGVTLGDPFVLSSETATMPDFASTSGSTHLFVWLDRRFTTIFLDVVSRAVGDFASLETAAEHETLVSYSGAAQYDVQFAAGDAGLLALWRDSNGALQGSLGGTPLTVAPEGSYTVGSHAVAAGNKNFLVAWYAGDYRGWQLLAKRIAFDGQVLDTEPLLLASGTATTLIDNPGIAYDGSGFLVAFAATRVHLARVADDGTVSERRTIGFDQSGARWPDPVWTGSAFLVPHTFHRFTFGCDICPIQWSIAVDDKVLFENAGTGTSMKITAAFGRNRVTLAWMSTQETTTSIYLAQLAPDGTPITAPFRLRDVPGFPTESIALAWNGSEYVLAWNDASAVIHALRLNQYAEPIDAEPFDVATENAGLYSRFSVTPTASGVAFGYDHRDAASGDVTRAFMRTLDRIPTGPRRRAAGR